MNGKQLLNLCLSFPDACADYPFDDGSTHVLRHRGNRKWYGMILQRNGKLCINLKCDPDKAVFWRSTYNGVIPAWHMNKVHWNTVYPNENIPLHDLQEMIDDSYCLTLPPQKRKVKP